MKDLQRRILRRLLKRLRCHAAARGFQPGESIVTHATLHAGRAVVLRLDLRDFFPSTGSSRVYQYFRRIGWNRPAARLLTNLCTHQGGLPQGAPTSPRLSNLLNYRLDARLAAMAARLGAHYSRYADDITLSFGQDDRDRIRYIIRFVKRAAADEGYRVHGRRKLRIRRRHQQQRVTGLVVNAGVRLPRQTRRWLRAVEHHLRTGRVATLTPEQFAGWQAFRQMVEGRPRTASPAPLPPPLVPVPVELDGAWVLVALQKNGHAIPVNMPAEGIGPAEWTFASGELRIAQGDHEERADCSVDASTEPPRITIRPAGQEAGTAQGIFRLEGDKLTICVSEEGQPLPSAIPSVPGTGWTVYHLRALARR
ncbi:MAG: TIGR03067 domain-containing protein [Planctomycetes bacterium]|nr:TIGR03067 domain-containing protein [Planctomycetota bacterium]